MSRIFSNGPAKDFVINPFQRFICSASRLYLASPYFTYAQPIIEAAQSEKIVQLLIGLNSATSPQAVAAVHGIPNLSVRYLTRRFHAKIFVFDDVALVGSANLTSGGLMENREAVICFDREEDRETIDGIKSLFVEMWESAQVLTSEKVSAFKSACAAISVEGPNPETLIENAVGRVEPINIHLSSRNQSRERLFLNELERQVYEEYRPAFNEVTRTLTKHGLRRQELTEFGPANETNRFLNWVRLTYAVGDEAWRFAPVRSADDRKNEISRLGAEWKVTLESKVDDNYIVWLRRVHAVFGEEQGLEHASKEVLTDGLMSLHAFTEQLRFVKGGAKNLPIEFWKANQDDLPRVKKSIITLLYGSGSFIQRLHDILYDSNRKLAYFGYFCALELYGTVKPEECPPINGRMAKALRYLGYSVRGA